MEADLCTIYSSWYFLRKVPTFVKEPKWPISRRKIGDEGGFKRWRGQEEMIATQHDLGAYKIWNKE
jgi:hypothetical protein